MDDKTRQAFGDLLNKMAKDWTAFNSAVVDFPIPPEPTDLSTERFLFRHHFLGEERDEFEKAWHAGDLDGQVDAIIDLMYVAIGTLGEMGVLVQPTWDEVQQANMRKRRGALSKRASGGYDAVKPEGWTAPSHADYLTITSDDVKLLKDFKEGRAIAHYPKRGIPVHVVGDPEPEPETFQPERTLKLAVLGYARHGKDTVCELLRDKYGLRFTSSSLFCAERVIMPEVKRQWDKWVERGTDHPQFGPYDSVEQCFEDRVNHRDLWFDLITAFNTPDKTRLGRMILEEYDVYAGIRNKAEFYALRNADSFDFTIWVDASDRGLPPEPRESCTVEPWMCDTVLDNGGSVEDLERNLDSLMQTLGVDPQ